jgi:serine protease inhibitor ecotin
LQYVKRIQDDIIILTGEDDTTGLDSWRYSYEVFEESSQMPDLMALSQSSKKKNNDARTDPEPNLAM